MDEATKAVLINSPSQLYGEAIPGQRELTPFGLASVATDAALRLGRENVSLIDAEYCGLTLPAILHEVGELTDGRGTVGLNVLTPTFNEAVSVAHALHREYSDLHIVFGGPHATLDPKSLLDVVPDATVVVGDGEEVFAKLASGVPREKLNGAVFFDKKQQGALVRGGSGLPNVIEDLNNLPWLDRSFVKNEPYDKNGLLTMTFLGGRGCRGSCAFCITPAQYETLKEGKAKKVRFRDLTDVVAEIKTRKEEHNLDLAQFLDDELLPTEKRVREFLDAWRQAGLYGNLEFIALLRPDRISSFSHSGLLSDLKQAGLRKLSLGIETGHNRGRRMLSSMAGKIDPKYDASVVSEAIQCLQEEEIETKGFFMVGLPGETRDEISETIQFMWELKDAGLSRAALFPVKVYPYTGLWFEALRLGFTPDQLGLYQAHDIANALSKGYDPKDVTRDRFTQSIQLSEMPIQELHDLCQDQMGRFNGET